MGSIKKIDVKAKKKEKPFKLHLEDGTDFFLQRFFRKGPKTGESDWTGAVISGIQGYGKTTMAKILFNLALSKPRFTLENTTRIFTNSMSIMFDEIKRQPPRPYVFAILDDAVRNMTGRSSMGVKRKADMANLTEVRHIHDARLAGIDFGKHHPHIWLIYTGQLPDQLDLTIRGTKKWHIQKSQVLEERLQKRIDNYYQKDPDLTRCLNDIVDRREKGDFTANSMGIWRTFGHAGFINVNKYFRLKERPAWNLVTEERDAHKDLLLKHVHALGDMFGWNPKADMDVMEARLFVLESDLPASIVRKIKSLYRGFSKIYEEEGCEDGDSEDAPPARTRMVNLPPWQVGTLSERIRAAIKARIILLGGKHFCGMRTTMLKALIDPWDDIGTGVKGFTKVLMGSISEIKDDTGIVMDCKTMHHTKGFFFYACEELSRIPPTERIVLPSWIPKPEQAEIQRRIEAMKPLIVNFPGEGRQVSVKKRLAASGTA